MPFAEARWSSEEAEAFQLIQEWFAAVRQIKLPAGISNNDETLEAEAKAIEQGISSGLLSENLNQRVFLIAKKLSLPLTWFASPIRVANQLQGSLRFEDGIALKRYIQSVIVPQGNLIARLADVAHTWQLPHVANLSTGFFVANKLVGLNADLEKDRLYFPVADLEQLGVGVDDLKKGNRTPAVKKLLWKQVIRVRDALAQGQPLVKEVPRKFRRSFKKNWLTGLEFVLEIERRDYDVWSEPIQLSGLQRFQIDVLSWIGKGAARARGR